MKFLVSSIVLLSTAAFASDEDMGRRVQALLREHQADVFACVRAESKAPAGEMLLRIFVGDAGRIGRIDVLKDESRSSELRGCLLAKVQSWSVAALGADSGDQVVFPLVFKPDPQPAPAIDTSITIVDGVALEARRTAVTPQPPAPKPFAALAKERAVIATGGGDIVLTFERGRRPQVTLRTGDVFWQRPASGFVASAKNGDGKFLVIEGPNLAGKVTPAEALVRADAISALAIAGGRGTVRLSLDGTDASFALDTITAQPGVEIPAHHHSDAREVIRVVSGEGTTWIAGVATPTKPGSLLDIPAGAEHSLKVTRALTAIQVYAPRGPEQRFKPQATSNQP